LRTFKFPTLGPVYSVFFSRLSFSRLNSSLPFSRLKWFRARNFEQFIFAFKNAIFEINDLSGNNVFHCVCCEHSLRTVHRWSPIICVKLFWMIFNTPHCVVGLYNTTVVVTKSVYMYLIIQNYSFWSGTWSWSYWIDWPSRRTPARCASTLRPAPCSSRVSTKASARLVHSSSKPAPCAGQLLSQSKSYRSPRKWTKNNLVWLQQLKPKEDTQDILTRSLISAYHLLSLRI